MELAGYLFPVALEDTISLDLSEALPLADVEYIGIGDKVAYERLNDRGKVVMRAFGTVTNVNHTTQSVQLCVTPLLRFWVNVNGGSLVSNGAADTAVFTTAPAV